LYLIYRSRQEAGTASIDFAQLLRFSGKNPTEGQRSNTVSDEDRTMENIQEGNDCINIPSSKLLDFIIIALTCT
jgi:hypothetical protein